MSRLFVNECNRYFHDPEILQRVIAGLDFAQLMQGANGGFENANHTTLWVGAPNRQNASGCLEGYGHQGFSGAYFLIKDHISDSILNTMVDADDSGSRTVPRRVAWVRLLVKSRDYLVGRTVPVYGRGHAPNQDVADQVASVLADSGLGELSPTEQLPRDDLLDIVYQAIGVKPAAGEGPGWRCALSVRMRVPLLTAQRRARSRAAGRSTPQARSGWARGRGRGRRDRAARSRWRWA